MASRRAAPPRATAAPSGPPAHRSASSAVASPPIADGERVIDLELKRGGERGKVLQMQATLQAGRYEIQEVLAYGGMGIVLRALDRKLAGNEVLVKAIKYAASEFAYDRQKAIYNLYQLRQMFRRERRILTELRLRGINDVPHLNDFFYDKNIEFRDRTYPFGKLEEHETHDFLGIQVEVQREPFLVMERIMGLPLGELLDVLPEASLLRIVRDALVVLSKMHAVRVREDGTKLQLLYLDLKPENLLVDRRHRMTLIDFGGTMPVVDGKKRKETKGALTFGYAAPELQTLFTSVDTVDRRADLYSVGALLWRIYTGNDPVKRADPITNQFPVLDPEELPLRMHPDLRDLVTRALERDPDRRWSTAEEMITVLDRHVQ